MVRGGRNSTIIRTIVRGVTEPTTVPAPIAYGGSRASFAGSGEQDPASGGRAARQLESFSASWLSIIRTFD